jgi:S-disulfanyl-L-cysteine oxidoreductase SoxD
MMKLRGNMALWVGLLVLALECDLFAQATGRWVRDGVYTLDQANRGKTLFEAHCVICHGPTLEGLDSAPPLAGPRFMGNWSGQSVGDLVERIRTTMPANAPGTLSRRVSVDLVAYVLSVNQLPAGTRELPVEASILDQIRITPPTP